MLRSSKNADQRKQWWYRVTGYFTELLNELFTFLKNLHIALSERIMYNVTDKQNNPLQFAVLFKNKKNSNQLLIIRRDIYLLKKLVK